MAEPRCLIVVQSRFASTRLPGKALLPLGGISMVAFVLRRLAAGLHGREFCLALATTTRRDDDAVAAEGEALGVPVVRGAVDDVLSRFADCLAAHPAQTVVRVTADNPLTCPDSIRALVGLMAEQGADYGRCSGYPLGASADAFAASTLAGLHAASLNRAEREHINKHVLDNPERFEVVQVDAPAHLARPEVSLTVDTAEDYERVAGLIGTLDLNPWTMPLAEALRRIAD